MHPTNIFVAPYTVSVFQLTPSFKRLAFQEERRDDSPLNILYAELRRLLGGNVIIEVNLANATTDGARGTAYDVRADGEHYAAYVYEVPRGKHAFNAAARHANLRDDSTPISRAALDALRLSGRDVVSEAVERATGRTLPREAADEIQRLSDEVQRLQRVVKTYDATATKIAQERDALRDERDAAEAHADDLFVRLRDAERRESQLRSVLDERNRDVARLNTEAIENHERADSAEERYNTLLELADVTRAAIDNTLDRLQRES